jgi:hypothetical protein
MSEYVSNLTLKQNDFGYDLEFSLTDADDKPVDLTDATEIKVFIAERNATVAKVVGVCAPVGDEKEGICKYTVKNGDFDEAPKEYEVEVEVAYDTTKNVTAFGVLINIEKELPESTT